MKLVRRLVFFIALGTTVFFVLFWELWVSKKDVEGPEITCEEEEYSASIDANEKELLKGMEAWDEKDKDVTDSLIIEKKEIIPGTKDFILTYAATDSSHNVSKYERTVTYEDYYSPHFKAAKPFRFAIGEEASLLSNFTAEDCMEGDITNRIKLEKKSGGSNGEGIQTYELSVSNQLGDTSILPISVEFYTDTYEERFSYPNIYLTDYIYYIKKGTEFKPTSLLKEIQIGNTVYQYDKDKKKFFEMEEVESDNKDTTEWKKKKNGKEIASKEISYKSDIDVSKQGIYTVEYSYQEKDGRIGTTQLIVVVE